MFIHSRGWNIEDVERSKYGNYQLVNAEAPDLPFTPGFFDLIVDMNNTLISTGKELWNCGKDTIPRIKHHYQKISNYLEVGSIWVLSKNDSYDVDGGMKTRLEDTEVVILRKRLDQRLEIVNGEFDEEYRVGNWREDLEEVI